MEELFFATPHAVKRAKERRGYNAKRALNWIKKALERGRDYTFYTARERDYLREEGKGDCFALAYDGFCFILDQRGVCVTLYELPRDFGRKKPYVGKTKIRNDKKYSIRYTKEDDHERFVA